MDPIGYYMGEPISEMSRERLLEVVKQLSIMHQQTEARHDRDMKVLSDLCAPPPRRRGPLGLW